MVGSGCLLPLITRERWPIQGSRYSGLEKKSATRYSVGGGVEGNDADGADDADPDG